jgi:hypothetical protein
MIELATTTCRFCHEQLALNDDTDAARTLEALFVLSITLGLRPGEPKRPGRYAGNTSTSAILPPITRVGKRGRMAIRTISRGYQDREITRRHQEEISGNTP